MVDSLRFPKDLVSGQIGGDAPFMQFKIIKYRNRNFLKDTQASAKPDPNAGKSLVEADALSNQLATAPDIRISKDEIEVANVYLPLPVNINNNISPDWEMADLRIIETMREAFSQDTPIGGLKQAALGVAAIATGELLKRTQIYGGITPNPKKQALFNGVQPRTFSFDWTLTPMTEDEANTLDRIVKTFQKYSLPSVLNNSFFNFPHEFRISFHSGLKGFPKPSVCVCTGVSTNYSGAGTQLLRSGHPVQTTLSLSFLETDLRTQDTPGV